MVGENSKTNYFLRILMAEKVKLAIIFSSFSKLIVIYSSFAVIRLLYPLPSLSLTNMSLRGLFRSTRIGHLLFLKKSESLICLN